MPNSSSNHNSRPLTVALYVNATLIAGLLVAVLAGRNRSPFDSIALAQPAPVPIAGGAGFYLMPAQFDSTHWGCYVMDVDAQTLIAYQYNPRGGGQPILQLVAARSFVNDRLLRSYNTLPKPDDVRQLVELERQGITGGVDPNAPTPAPGDPTSRPIVPREP